MLSVVAMLGTALSDSFKRSLIDFGSQLACRLSRIAQEWGNPLAASWCDDKTFAEFWSVMHMNSIASAR
jgi:hypothetical protein